MMMNRSTEYLMGLVQELRNFPKETEWVEFKVNAHDTRVVLFAPRPLSSMDRTDRVRAVYLHACLRYVNREYVTNTSIRRRFGIEVRNSAKASRLIAESVEQGAIAHDDPTSAPKLMRYVPWWAKGEARAVT